MNNGGPTAVSGEGGLEPMGGWSGDLKISVRQLAGAPGFTAAAILVLAVGIGLNAAMFSLVYAMGFMGRPFAEPDRIVQLYSSQREDQPLRSHRTAASALMRRLDGTVSSSYFCFAQVENPNGT